MDTKDLSERVSLLIAALQSHLSNMQDMQTIVAAMPKGKKKEREGDSRTVGLQGKHTSLAWKVSEIAADVEAALPLTILPPFPQKPNKVQIQAFIAALDAAEVKL